MFKPHLSCLMVFVTWILLADLAMADDDAFIEHQYGAFVVENVSLVDGSGAPVKHNQSVVVRQGQITQVVASDSFTPEQGLELIDGRGKTLLPGLVLMHEHMFYPTGRRNYTEMLYSFPRLYLAGGVTTVRTAGTTAPYADLNLRQAIQEGAMLGPDMDVTAPYLNGSGLQILKINALSGAFDAKRMVSYWADEGATSYKAYMHIASEELQAVIDLAHSKGHKVTAHLCSVTYREAAAMGIDNLEHGFFAATDFVAEKRKDECPGRGELLQSLADLDLDSAPVQSLIAFLIEKNVTITSTLTVYETYAPGRPLASEGALALMIPQVREQYTSTHQQIAETTDSLWPKVLNKMMALEKRFVEAGGTLMVGTDPTGYGGVVAGYSSKRALELLVEAGFSFEQAVKLASLNGARFLNRADQVGSIEVGKRSDMVLVNGQPAEKIEDIQNIELVFKNGIGYSSPKILAAMKETVGQY